MNIHGLLANLESRWAKAAVALASNTDDNSARIDMIDYESAMFITSIEDSVATGVGTLKVEQNDDDSDTGMAAITGATATKTCVVNDDINGQLLIVEVRNPSKRYIQGVRTSATANIAFGSVIVLLKPRIFPSVQGATVAASTYVSD
ncbi:hypothetical protein NKH17_12450 [Mesorhizobium sp. M1334]|uniref:hypothetical protein n=1 Tax=Mesorhizobium sp. M1334 TaxID=2957084 RepID=UPI00333D0085